MDAISAFWLWFEDNLGRLRAVLQNPAHPDREYVVNSLDQHILAIGMFTWDIEEGQSRPWSLVISPNSDPELLEISGDIVARAPELSDWEFHPARPRKAQPLKFQVYDEAMDLQWVDASNWRYVLIPAGDEQFSLVVETNGNTHLSEETLQKAAQHLVTCLVGEEITILHLPRMRVVRLLTEELRDSGRPLLGLWVHLGALI